MRSGEHREQVEGVDGICGRVEGWMSGNDIVVAGVVRARSWLPEQSVLEDHQVVEAFLLRE